MNIYTSSPQIRYGQTTIINGYSGETLIFEPMDVDQTISNLFRVTEPHSQLSLPEYYNPTQLVPDYSNILSRIEQRQQEKALKRKRTSEEVLNSEEMNVASTLATDLKNVIINDIPCKKAKVHSEEVDLSLEDEAEKLSTFQEVSQDFLHEELLKEKEAFFSYFKLIKDHPYNSLFIKDIKISPETVIDQVENENLNNMGLEKIIIFRVVSCENSEILKALGHPKKSKVLATKATAIKIAKVMLDFSKRGIYLWEMSKEKALNLINQKLKENHESVIRLKTVEKSWSKIQNGDPWPLENEKAVFIDYSIKNRFMSKFIALNHLYMTRYGKKIRKLRISALNDFLGIK